MDGSFTPVLFRKKSEREVLRRRHRHRDEMGDAEWMVVGLDFFDNGWSDVGSVSRSRKCVLALLFQRRNEALVAKRSNSL